MEKTSGISSREREKYPQFLLNLIYFRIGEKNKPVIERVVKDKTGKLVSFEVKREIMRTK